MLILVLDFSQCSADLIILILEISEIITNLTIIRIVGWDYYHYFLFSFK